LLEIRSRIAALLASIKIDAEAAARPDVE